MARSKTRSITLKGNLAKIFVEGHNPKAEDTEDQVLERIALAIHMDMATGQVQRAVATLKSFRANGVASKHEPSKPTSGSRASTTLVGTPQVSESGTKDT